ncbi:MAG TPA: VOC family protein [Ignavibacteriaceae bacterium]|nr:VOC family protein [Ignavibacteriaceae bacterium]
MSLKIKYVHTNIVAKNWKKLADFYINVFGCPVIPPIRNSSGNDLDSAVNIKNVVLNGVHLLLPGYNKTGPTLEIFSYNPPLKKQNRKVNTPGITHIAFEVNDVNKVYKKVLKNGGKKVGKIITLTRSDGKEVTWCYVKDPEGNMIELQKWDK